MELICTTCKATRTVHPATPGTWPLECDSCAAAEVLACEGLTPTGQTAYRRGVKIGLNVEFDSDYELTPEVAQSRRRGRPPITAQSRAAKQAVTETTNCAEAL